MTGSTQGSKSEQHSTGGIAGTLEGNLALEAQDAGHRNARVSFVGMLPLLNYEIQYSDLEVKCLSNWRLYKHVPT